MFFGTFTAKILVIMSTQDVLFDPVPKKRPVFLLVLCILTFCGSGISLFSNVYSYLTANKAAADMERAKRMMENGKDAGSKKMAEFFGTMADSMTAEKIQYMAGAGLLAAVLCLIGAFLMLKLRKTGFIFYVAGTIVGVALPFIIMGSNLFSTVSVVIGGLIGVAFCIMYAVNLKEMN